MQVISFNRSYYQPPKKRAVAVNEDRFRTTSSDYGSFYKKVRRPGDEEDQLVVEVHVPPHTHPCVIFVYDEPDYSLSQ